MKRIAFALAFVAVVASCKKAEQEQPAQSVDTTHIMADSTTMMGDSTKMVDTTKHP